jgi:hypothetical protein
VTEQEAATGSAPPEPWARLPCESARAYEAADVYFSLGPGRSVTKVARELSKSVGLCQRWSSRHRWVDRAAAWDARAVGLQRERDDVERWERRREMLERHARLGRRMTGAAEGRLADLDTTALTAADVVRLADAGSRLERLSRGEPLALATRAEVGRFVDGLVDVALGFIEEGRQESFLVEVEARCGEPAS